MIILELAKSALFDRKKYVLYNLLYTLFLILNDHHLIKSKCDMLIYFKQKNIFYYFFLIIVKSDLDFLVQIFDKRGFLQY